MTRTNERAFYGDFCKKEQKLSNAFEKSLKWQCVLLLLLIDQIDLAFM